MYRDGVYAPRAEEIIAGHVKEILRFNCFERKFRKRLVDETLEWIRITAKKLPPVPPLGILNLDNGLLEITERDAKPYYDLKKHDPGFLSVTQLPVSFDPDKNCPAWEEQIKATWPEDCVEAGLPWEIVAYFMEPRTSLQKAILLLGLGNGKSTFLSGLTAFIGQRNISNVPLQKLEEDRFARSQLLGKLGNICADLPSRDLETTAVFKRITGGDPIDAEFKFGTGFTFQNYCRLAFSANQPPVALDTCDNFFERWLVVPFSNKFRGTPNEKDSQELHAVLTSKSELSGVLNKALKARDRVKLEGFSEPESCKRAHEEFIAATDGFAGWLRNQMVVAPHAYVPKSQAFQAFNAFAARHGRPVMTETAFSLQMKKRIPNIGESRLTAGDQRPNCWVGIGLAQSGSTESK